MLLVGLEGGETLAVTTGPDARVGLVLYDMRNARGELQRVLGSGSSEPDDVGSETEGPGERKQ